MTTSLKLRKAALALHGLNKSDCDWVLGQLSTSQRAALTPLLQELRDLGISSSITLEKALFVADESAQVGGDIGTDSELTQIILSLDVLSAEQVNQVLAGEPLPLIVYFLSLKRWAWRTDFLNQLPLPERRNLEDLLKASVSNRADDLNELALSLCRLVLKRAETLDSSKPQTMVGFWQNVLKKVRR